MIREAEILAAIRHTPDARAALGEALEAAYAGNGVRVRLACAMAADAVVEQWPELHVDPVALAHVLAMSIEQGADRRN